VRRRQFLLGGALIEPHPPRVLSPDQHQRQANPSGGESEPCSESLGMPKLCCRQIGDHLLQGGVANTPNFCTPVASAVAAKLAQPRGTVRWRVFCS
jgi:hypothetical protein